MKKGVFIFCTFWFYLSCIAQTPKMTSPKRFSYTVAVDNPKMTSQDGMLYRVIYADWTSTNKEDGTMSSKVMSFQGDKGDVFSFDWNVSSEEFCDKFVAVIDGGNVLSKSGEDSGTFEYQLQSSGSHTAEFIYAKDYFSSAGKDEVSIKNVKVNCCGNTYDRYTYELTSENYLDSGEKTESFKVDATDGDTLIFDFYHNHRSDGISELVVYVDGNAVFTSSYGPNTGKTDVRTIAIPLNNGKHRIGFYRKNYIDKKSGYYYVVVIDRVEFRHYRDNQKSSLKLNDDSKIRVYYSTRVNDFEYSRTFNNTKWQALYVPFTMSYDDWKNDFEIAKINDINMYDTDGDGEIDDTELEIIRVTKGTLKPNHPYLIKAKTTGNKVIKLSDVMLYPKQDTIDVSSAEMKYTFIGTTNGISGKYFVDNHYYAMASGSLCQTESTSTDLKPFRWYMKVESRDPQVILPNTNNSRIRIKVLGDDETTDIEDIEIASGNPTVYSLDGRVASMNGTEGLSKGIYIANGKKIIVK